MIRSMTAFAAVERATAAGTLALELRAVNHRYLELSLRLPDELRVLEPILREKVSAKISRGKLDAPRAIRAASGDDGNEGSACACSQIVSSASTTLAASGGRSSGRFWISASTSASKPVWLSSAGGARKRWSSSSVTSGPSNGVRPERSS